jgi:hypothetical protein
VSVEPPPEPVATVKLNVEPSPLVNVNTLLVTEPVVSKDAVDTVVPAFKANEAVVANDEDTANDDVRLFITLPGTLIEPVTINEPDTFNEELTNTPFTPVIDTVCAAELSTNT